MLNESYSLLAGGNVSKPKAHYSNNKAATLDPKPSKPIRSALLIQCFSASIGNQITMKSQSYEMR